MPFFAEDYIKPQQDLASLAQTKATTEAIKQQNEIRQLEVDATKKLGELTTYAEPTEVPTTPTLTQATEPKDLPFAYKQVDTANKTLASAKQQEQQALDLMKASQNTAKYDNYKEAYTYAQKKVAEAQAEQQKLVEDQLNEVLSPALAIQPNGAGYDLFKKAFVDHYVAAGVAQGIRPEEAERMRRDAMSQMPATWGPQAKAYVEHYAKSLRDFKESMEIDKRFLEKQKEENDARYQDKMAAAAAIKLDIASNKQGSVDNAVVLKDLEKDQQTKTAALNGLRQEQTRLHKLLDANPADEDVSVQLADVQDKVKTTEGYINALSSQIALQREVVAKTPNKPATSSYTKTYSKNKSTSNVEGEATKAFGSYEPTKYDYRVSPEGKVQRKLKG